MLINFEIKKLSLDSIMPFGKYKGHLIETVPWSYIQWMVKNVNRYEYDDELIWISKNYTKQKKYYEPKYYSEEEIIETSKYAPHRAMEMAEEMRFDGNGVSLETWKKVCTTVQLCESGYIKGW